LEIRRTTPKEQSAFIVSKHKVLVRYFCDIYNHNHKINSINYSGMKVEEPGKKSGFFAKVF